MSTSSPAPAAPPAASVEKVDPVKAARAEAQCLAKERADAAATAAANRATKTAKAKAKAQAKAVKINLEEHIMAFPLISPIKNDSDAEYRYGTLIAKLFSYNMFIFPISLAHTFVLPSFATNPNMMQPETQPLTRQYEIELKAQGRFQPAAMLACQKEMVEGKGTENELNKHVNMSSMPTVAQSATGSALPRRRRDTCGKTHLPAGPPPSTEAAPTAVSSSSLPQVNPQPSETRDAHVPSSRPKKKEKVISRGKIDSKHRTTTRVHLSWPTNINEPMEPELTDLFPTERYVEHTQPSRSPSPAVLSQMDSDFTMLSLVSEVFAEEFRSAVQSRENTPQKAQTSQKSPHSLEACLARSSALRGANLFNELIASSAEEESATRNLLEEISEGTRMEITEEGGQFKTRPVNERVDGFALRATDCDLYAISSSRGVLRGIGSQVAFFEKSREEEIEVVSEEQSDELKNVPQKETMPAEKLELCKVSFPNENMADDAKVVQESAGKTLKNDESGEIDEVEMLEEVEECVESEEENPNVEENSKKGLMESFSAAAIPSVASVLTKAVDDSDAELTEELIPPHKTCAFLDGTSSLEFSASTEVIVPALLGEAHFAASHNNANDIGHNERRAMCAVGRSSAATQSCDSNAVVDVADVDIGCTAGTHAVENARVQQTAAAPVRQEECASSSSSGVVELLEEQDNAPLLLEAAGPTESNAYEQQDQQQKQQPKMCDAATNTEENDPSPSDVNTEGPPSVQRGLKSWFPKIPRLFRSGKTKL